MTRWGCVREACAYSQENRSQVWHAWLGRGVLLSALVALVAAPAAGKSKVERRLDEAALVLEATLDSADQGIPSNLLSRADCVGVFPSVWKGAFFLGGRYGKGVVTCRQSDNSWSAPANFLIEGGNIGLQIGGQATDIVLLFMGEKSVRRLMRTKFTLGGEASVSGGPVGRTAQAQTDALFGAGILSYSRSRGVFAGIALGGATMRPAHKADRNLYQGSAPRTTDILRGGVEPPEAARRLLALLAKYSPEKRRRSD